MKLNIVHYLGRQICQRKLRVSHAEKSEPKSLFLEM